MTCRSFGYHVIRAYEYAPKAYKKNKAYHDTNEHIPDPVELVKYSIKIFDWLPGDDEKVSLKELQQINDPYEIGTFDKFCGRFEYDYDKKGFVPAYIETEGTRAMKSMYDKIEPPRVAKMWSHARKYVVDPNGDMPELIYEGEPT